MKRKIALGIIKIEYAKHGRSTGEAVRAMIEGKISLQKFNEQATIGFNYYKNHTKTQ